MSVIEFELEGANSSVENSIKQLTAALSVQANDMPAPTRLPKKLAAGDAGEQQHGEEVEIEAEIVEEATDRLRYGTIAQGSNQSRSRQHISTI